MNTLKLLEIAVSRLVQYEDNHSGCSTFGLIKTDGVKREYVAYMCHAPLRFIQSGEVILWSKTIRRDQCDPKLAAEYLHHLTHNSAPYSKYFSHEPCIVSGFDINSDEFRFKYGLIFTDLTMPNNHLMSVITATRFATESPERLVVWSKFSKLGVNPDLAYFAAGFCREDKGHLVIDFILNSNHWPISFNAGVKSARNFVRGEPVAESKLVSTLFGPVETPSLKTQIEQLAKPSTITGLFGPVPQYRATYNNVAKALKELEL